MAEHLTIVTLRRAVSAHAGVSEKVADDFLSALLDTVQEGLTKDENVSINGLGTFRLQDVPARESVNVATGERITIAGYKKVVFTTGTPRNNSKKQEEFIDPIKKLGEQAEEIKDILSELGAMDQPDITPTDRTDQTDNKEPVVPTDDTDQTDYKEPVVPTDGTDQTDNKEQPTAESQEPKKPFNAWLTGLITIGVFAVLLIIAYFVLRHQIVRWADGMRTTIEQRVDGGEDITPTDGTDQTDNKELIAPTDGTDQTDNKELVAPTDLTDQTDYYNDAQRVFTEFEATETVGEASRLAWIAKKHYGEKALWVFIYEANRDRLSRPDFVLQGQQLRIPKLPAELRDVNNPKTAALLERLSQQYLK